MSTIVAKKEEACVKCGKPCEKIGELNKIGQKKEYCCKCYGLMDSYFNKKLWCKICLT